MGVGVEVALGLGVKLVANVGHEVATAKGRWSRPNSLYRLGSPKGGYEGQPVNRQMDILRSESLNS
jgi:hypothetical protein